MAQFSIESPTFGTPPNEAQFGSDLFVDAVELKTVINTTSITFSIDGLNDDELMGFEGRDTTYPIPLRLFLSPLLLPAHVGGENKRDFSGCGWSGYPCVSISQAVANHFTLPHPSPLHILIDTSAQLKSALSLTAGPESSIDGSEKGTVVTVTDEIHNTQPGFIDVKTE
jgi:hypothetical protein